MCVRCKTATCVRWCHDISDPFIIRARACVCVCVQILQQIKGIVDDDDDDDDAEPDYDVLSDVMNQQQHHRGACVGGSRDDRTTNTSNPDVISCGGGGGGGAGESQQSRPYNCSNKTLRSAFVKRYNALSKRSAKNKQQRRPALEQVFDNAAFHHRDHVWLTLTAAQLSKSITLSCISKTSWRNAAFLIDGSGIGTPCSCAPPFASPGSSKPSLRQHIHTMVEMLRRPTDRVHVSRYIKTVEQQNREKRCYAHQYIDTVATCCTFLNVAVSQWMWWTRRFHRFLSSTRQRSRSHCCLHAFANTQMTTDITL